MKFGESIMLVKVSWMRYYQWQVGDTPLSDIGYLKDMEWVDGVADIDDNTNFVDVYGYCYGSFQTKGNSPHIEEIEGAPKDKHCKSVENVLVIFCALNPERKGKNEVNIIGWYAGAKVYREYQDDNRFD